MLWVALALPQLPIATHARADPGDAPAVPMALVRQHKLVLVNQAAMAAGVGAGQKRAGALMICPTLRIVERDVDREVAALHEAALALLRYTPHVALVRSADGCNGLLLELQSSLRLFGGLDVLLHAIRYTITELGFDTDIASFPTATGAWLLAQSARLPPSIRQSTDSRLPPDALDLLDRLPVALLDSAQAHLDALHGIGMRCLGQLRHLPRDGVARRFGQALLDELGRAYGDLPDPRCWFQAPLEFQARVELHARVESAEALLFAARRLLVQLVGWLSARHASVREFTLWLNHEPGHQTLYGTQTSSDRIAIALAEASRDLDHLTLLLREHLARMRLQAPVLELALHAERIEALPAPNASLFPSPSNQTENLTRLIERLEARLGSDAVRRLQLVEDHRPEHAQQFTPVTDAATQTNPSPDRPPRPTWLLPDPLRLRVRDDKPFHHSRLDLVAGPERIEAGWWNGTAVRDYFVAENDDAELLWVYRERLTGGDEHWYLHGKFA